MRWNKDVEWFCHWDKDANAISGNLMMVSTYSTYREAREAVERIAEADAGATVRARLVRLSGR